MSKRLYVFIMTVVTGLVVSACWKSQLQKVDKKPINSAIVEVTETMAIVAMREEAIPLEPDWTNTEEALKIHEQNPHFAVSEYNYKTEYKRYRNSVGSEVLVKVALEAGQIERREDEKVATYYIDAIGLPYNYKVIVHVPTTKRHTFTLQDRDETAFSVVLNLDANEVVCVRFSKEIGKRIPIDEPMKAALTAMQKEYGEGYDDYMYPYIVHNTKDGTFFSIWTEDGVKRDRSIPWMLQADLEIVRKLRERSVFAHRIDSYVYDSDNSLNLTFVKDSKEIFFLETNDKNEKWIRTLNIPGPLLDMPYIEDDTRIDKSVLNLEEEIKECKEFIVIPVNGKIKCIGKIGGHYGLVIQEINEGRYETLKRLLDEESYCPEYIHKKEKNWLDEVEKGYILPNYEKTMELLDYIIQNSSEE